MKSSNSITILHISDIHFGMTDSSGAQDRISDAIVDSINEFKEKIDIVVFTGDLAQAGRALELQQGQEWLERVCKAANAKCILVPGNHDINRNLADSKILRAARGSQDEFGTWNNDILKNHPHINSFLDWFKSCIEESDYFLNKWTANPIIDTIEVILDGKTCKFICLNTAYLSCGDDDEGKLCVDIRSLNSALRASHPESELIIAVGHHPTSCLTDWNREQIEQILQQKTGPHAYLHGHLHHTDNTSIYKHTGAGLFTGAAGAAYPGAKYPKNYSILQFNFQNREIACKTFIFNDSSGQWVLDAKLANSIPCRLPLNISHSEQSNTNSIIPHSLISSVKNPFHDYMANGMDPEDIHLLFVERRNSLQDIKTKHDSVIEGQRGTGKTMLLRYFSIEVQKSLLNLKQGSKLIKELNERETPFGIYCCLTNAGLDRSDFQAIPDKNRARLIFSHLATLFIITKFLKSIALSLLSTNENDSILTKPLRTRLLRTLKINQNENIPDAAFIENIIEEISTLRDNAYEHLASCLPGGTPTPFNPWLNLNSTLFDILEAFKERLEFSQPFFLLIDDFDKLDSLQQSVFFSAAAARRHDMICFKFGSMSEGIKSNVTVDGRRYSEGDDYDHIRLDWVDGGIDPEKNNEYKDSLEEITKRRLGRASWPDNITLDTLFDNWAQGSKIRADIRQKSKDDFSIIRRPNSNQTFDSYWSKQGTAIYFRHLAKKKIPHRYAGPSTIIEVSSGIYRQFLEVCGRIVNSAISRGWNPNLGRIGVDTQNRCIREWSTGMYKNLESSGDATNLSSGNVIITSDHLTNLANSLSQYFRWRLLSESNDPEVIAISLKDDLQPGSFAKALLDVAVRETLLQRRATDYTNKSGDGKRLPTYQLNRRLTPHVGIGTKIQGRYEMNSNILELAAKDTELFLRTMKGSPTEQQETLIFTEEHK